MAHRDKTANTPGAPNLLSRIRSAAVNAYRKMDAPLSGNPMQTPSMPSMSGLKNPKQWAKQMGQGYLSHLKTLSSRGGVTRALKDVSPLSLGLTVLPELTGNGIISATKNAPEGQKVRTLGGALGGLLGGQLMWRTGLLGSIGGSYLGSRLGERIGDAVTGKRSKKKNQPSQAELAHRRGFLPVNMNPGSAGYGVDPRITPFKTATQHLPEVSGTLPPLSMGGPGREDVSRKGRVSNRNNEYFGGDTLRNVGDLDKIFHVGRGLGSQGGQPYADSSIYRHLRLDPSDKVNQKSKRELGDSSVDSSSSDYL